MAKYYSKAHGGARIKWILCLFFASASIGSEKHTLSLCWMYTGSTLSEVDCLILLPPLPAAPAIRTHQNINSICHLSTPRRTFTKQLRQQVCYGTKAPTQGRLFIHGFWIARFAKKRPNNLTPQFKTSLNSYGFEMYLESQILRFLPMTFEVRVLQRQLDNIVCSEGFLP